MVLYAHFIRHVIIRVYDRKCSLCIYLMDGWKNWLIVFNGWVFGVKQRFTKIAIALIGRARLRFARTFNISWSVTIPKELYLCKSVSPLCIFTIYNWLIVRLIIAHSYFGSMSLTSAAVKYVTRFCPLTIEKPIWII